MISSPLIKWVKQLPQILLAGLSLTIFTGLDLMDSIFCVVFGFLDEFIEGDAATPCYCRQVRRKNDTTTDASETLYGDGRRNFFREMGLVCWFIRRLEVLRERKGCAHQLRRSRQKLINRWTDCGCESCLSWINKKKKKKDDDDDINGVADFRLHVVVQEPLTSPAYVEDSIAKSPENVVFLHGFISSSSFWKETVFCNLSVQGGKDYRLFAVDLLGFGRSPKPRDCLYTLKDHLEMIERSVIVTFGLNSFHLVGHSMGSVIALALAAKHPESVKSVTLVAPPYFPSPRDAASSLALRKLAGKRLWPPVLFGASFMSWYEHLGRIICFIICRNHRIWESIIRLLTGKRDLHFLIMDLTRHTHHSAWHTMHNVICGGAKLVDENLEILSRRRVKTIIIQGDEDQVVPPECSYNMRMKVPDADVRVIPKVDHITFVLNRTKDFTQTLEGIWSSCM